MKNELLKVIVFIHGAILGISVLLSAVLVGICYGVAKGDVTIDFKTLRDPNLDKVSYTDYYRKY